MKRKPQKGQVYREGDWWFLRYYDWRLIDNALVRKRVRQRLGPIDAMDAEQALAAGADVMHTVQGSDIEPENCYSLPDFVEQVYFPLVEPNLRPSTLRSYKVVWSDQIAPFVSKPKLLWTKDTKTKHLQRVLNEMAKTGRFNISSLKRAKSLLSAVFKLAIQQGYYRSEWQNPVRGCSLPKARPENETHAYTLDEVEAMLAALPEPAATIVATAAYTGLRRGELRGLRWENIRDGEILVGCSVWNGISTKPKTKKSAAPVPLIKPLAARLEFHRAKQGDPAPTSGWVFRNEAGEAMCLGNLVARSILPALNRCATCGKSERDHDRHPAKFEHKYVRDASLPEWRGWHAFRRGLSSDLYALGVRSKTIQDVMRHSDVATTLKHYVKTTGEAERDGMQRLEALLLDRSLDRKCTIRATPVLQ